MEATSLVRALPRLMRRPPADLVAVLAATVLVNGFVFAPVLRDLFFRVPIGLVFVLFVPGYAVVSALFPEHGPSAGGDGDGGRTGGRPVQETDTRSWWRRIDGPDRIALSVALSVTIVPLIATVITSLHGLRLGLILGAVSLFTIGATVIAMQRRLAVPRANRFRVPYREWMAAIRTAGFGPSTRREAMLNIALVGAILLALTSVAYAATVLPQDEQYSTLTVLPAGDEEIAGNESLLDVESGESQEITVTVDNHEERTVEYSVVVVEQQLEPRGEQSDGEGNDARLVEQRELDRFGAQVAPGETWQQTHSLEPTIDGENVRIVWLLYVDGAPADPSISSADYHAYLWRE